MPTEIAGVVLAGGRSLRMGGGDKALLAVDGRSLLERVIERARPQVGTLLINANGDPARFAALGLPVVADCVGGYVGPMAGILTGLEWVREHLPDVEWMASFATDTPLLPTDLVQRLSAAVQTAEADLACATSGGITHPVSGLWPVRLAPALRHALIDEELRKTDGWTSRYRVAHVEWPGGIHDPFFNVNTPEELMRLKLILSGGLTEQPPLRDSLAVTVVVERRSADEASRQDIWMPVAVHADPPAADGWHLLERGDGWERYVSSGHRLDLDCCDLAGYRANLASGSPRLYVALHPAPKTDASVRVGMVTAVPDSGHDMAWPVPMPAEVVTWLLSFTARHPLERPMRKGRRNNPPQSALPPPPAIP